MTTYAIAIKMMLVGKYLKEGTSVAEIAKYSGLSKSTIYRWKKVMGI